MEYRNLGTSGVKVSVIALGAMNFGPNPSGNWIGKGTPKDEAIEITRYAVEQGVNFIDTADLYGGGVSEEYLGEALEGIREGVVLATKVNAPMGPGPNDKGLSAYHIKRACEGSLRRLRTDRIDLYQLHTASLEVPHEETLRALDDLVREGKVIYIGCSNYPGWKVAEAKGICDRMGWNHFVSVQPRYSLMYRGAELDILPVCDTYGLGLLPWSPLAAGLLSGKYSRSEKPADGTRWAGYPYNEQYESLTDVDWQIVEAVADIAAQRGVGSVQVACGWLLSRRAVSSVLGGARTVEQMKSYIAAADVTLTAEEVERLDTVSASKVEPSVVEPRPAPELVV